MKNLFQEHNKKWCSKRVMSIIFGLSAVIGYFMELDPMITASFLGASIGNHVMTTNKLENHDNTN